MCSEKAEQVVRLWQLSQLHIPIVAKGPLVLCLVVLQQALPPPLVRLRLLLQVQQLQRPLQPPSYGFCI